MLCLGPRRRIFGCGRESVRYVQYSKLALIERGLCALQGLYRQAT